MATKKKAAEAPVSIPAGLTAEDGNRTVARSKAALLKKWSASPSKSTTGVVQVAWFLVALGREAEARALVEAFASELGAAALDFGSPASNVFTLAARLARRAGDDGRHADLISRLAAGSAGGALSTAAFAKEMSEATKDIRSAEVDPSQKFACEGFAQGCARAASLRELGTSAGPEADAAAASLDVIIEDGLAGLRAQLGR